MSWKPPPKWEDALRKGAVAAGTGLEWAINKTKELKSGMRTNIMSAQPVLSLEGQIAVPKLKELINSAVEKVVSVSIPGLVDRTALEVREGPPKFAKLFHERGVSFAVNVDIGGGAGSYGAPEAGTNSARGMPSRLPFEDGFFDHVIGLYASQYQGDIAKAVKEFSRVLAVSGEGVVVDFHPFGMYAKRGNQRLRPISSTIHGIEDYFKMCRTSALKVTDVKESFLDESLRQLFVTEEEKQSFRIVKDTPLLIYLFVKKGG